ncbi:MAG: hypothetical protein ACE5QW_08920, partial [Thermoplasmata archaeon]
SGTSSRGPVLRIGCLGTRAAAKPKPRRPQVPAERIAKADPNVALSIPNFTELQVLGREVVLLSGVNARKEHFA